MSRGQREDETDLEVSRLATVLPPIAAVNGTVARTAQHGQIPPAAVVCQAPRDDVVDVNSDAVLSLSGASRACSVLLLQDATADGGPLPSVLEIGSRPDSLGDVRASTATEDVSLHWAAAVRTIPLGRLQRHPTGHTVAFVFESQDLPAPDADGFWASGALHSMQVRTRPAPLSGTHAGSDATRGAQSDGHAMGDGCAGRAALGAPLNACPAIDAEFWRKSLARDFARLTSSRIPHDWLLTVDAQQRNHCTNMIPCRRIR